MKKLWKLMLTIGLVAILALSIFPASALAIQNGSHDGSNHPYVVMCVFDVEGTPTWRTTGFLISPTVVVTAGHGTYGTDGARVSTLDYIPSGYEGYPGTGSWAVEASGINTHPLYRSTPGPGLPNFDSYDVGVIILSEPIYLSEYAVLPDAGYVDTLKNNSPVDLVGYGVTDQYRGKGATAGNSWMWDRYRNYAPAYLIPSKGVISNMFLSVSANKGRDTGGTTFGDSGGPIFKAETNTVLGLNSFVNTYNCDGVTYAQRIDLLDILEWIEGFMD
jgi:hypothetical protein